MFRSAGPRKRAKPEETDRKRTSEDCFNYPDEGGRERERKKEGKLITFMEPE